MASKRSIAAQGSSSKSGMFSKGRSPHSRSNAHSVRRSWPYTRAVFLWMFANFTILLSIGALAYGAKMGYKDIVIYGAIGVGVFLFFKLCFIFASKATPCPLCRANHLARTRSKKHKDAYKLLLFSYSSTAVLTAFFKGCVRCMHCGVTFALNRHHKS